MKKETAMGTNINAQTQDSDYIKAIHRQVIVKHTLAQLWNLHICINNAFILEFQKLQPTSSSRFGSTFLTLYITSWVPQDGNMRNIWILFMRSPQRLEFGSFLLQHLRSKFSFWLRWFKKERQKLTRKLKMIKPSLLQVE